jgi:hypothetical protein
MPPLPKMAPSPSRVGPLKKMSILKVVRLKVKTGLQGMSKIELTVAKLVGMSKKICLLDVMASSHGVCCAGLTAARAGERAARVVAFDNLGNESSPNAHQTPSLKRAAEKCAAPLSSMSR